MGQKQVKILEIRLQTSFLRFFFSQMGWGVNKNGWVGGISWCGTTAGYKGAKIESFEIGRITKLDGCYYYLTIKQEKEQARKEKGRLQGQQRHQQQQQQQNHQQQKQQRRLVRRSQLGMWY